MSIIAALEQAIVAAPDEPKGYEVLADALQEAGDPHGELIAEHIRLQTTLGGGLEVLARLEDRLFAPDPPAAIAPRWRWGFVHELQADLAAVGVEPVRRVLRAPDCRFLRMLELHAGAGELGALPEVVGGRATLKRLRLSCDQGGATADLSGLWSGLPALTGLSLTGGWFEAGTLPASRLAALTLGVAPEDDLDGERSLEHLSWLGSSAWPRLRFLSLCLDDQDGTLEELFSATRLPALRELRLQRSPLVPLFGRLTALPILTLLETLELSGQLDGEQLIDFLDELPRLRKLKAIILKVHQGSNVDRRVLRQLSAFPNVRVAVERYAGAGE